VSGAEIGYLVRRPLVRGLRRAGAALHLGAAVRSGLDLGSCRFLRGPDGQLFVPPLEPSGEDDRALLLGQMPIYGRWIEWRDDPAFWHTDPLFGRTWPLRRTRLIAYRPGNPTGDVRVVWELNRLQHLVPLARIAGEDPAARSRAVGLFDAQLRSWVAANPAGMGVNYASAMEEALRLVSVAHAFDLARPHLTGGIGDLVGELVIGHALDVEGRLSLHSSAGNHTIAEAVGLLYAGVLFDEHPRSRTWERVGTEILRAEGERQVNGDGGGLEQSTWYLLFVADLLGLAQALLGHRERRPIPELDAAVARARDFLCSLASSPRDLPPIGDGDAGHALSPRLLISWPRKEEREIARQFARTGLTLVAAGGAERLLFLHNPLGMPPSCGHGHADCLSVLFRRRGVDLLLDPGTYLYGGPPALRRYFRSTAAHNTVEVDGDQAEQVAPFMWKGSYRCQVLLSHTEPGGHSILARHDAYRRRRITHWRGVAYSPGCFLAVWDRIDDGAGCDPTVHWHLGCPAHLEPGRGELVLEPPGSEPLRMSLPEGDTALFEGSGEPLLGWRSASYGLREPSPTLRSRPFTRSRREAVTVLWLAPGPRPLHDVDRLLNRFRAASAGSR